MKKAGIIVGAFFIIAAIAVFGISTYVSNHKSEPKEVEKDNSPKVEEVQQPINNEVQEQNEVVEQPPVVNTAPPVQTQVIEKEISEVKTIKESDLTNNKGAHDVIAVISNKRIMLIDENSQGTDKKTLTYCFDVLTPDNQALVLFVTKNVYDSYNVQDRLQVKYEVFVNDSGVEFPIVTEVTAVAA